MKKQIKRTRKKNNKKSNRSMSKDEFVSYALKNLFKHGISVKFVHGSKKIKGKPKRSLNLEEDNINSSGYFCDEEKVLYCQIDDKDESWFEIFVHEYCHFLQYVDKAFRDLSYWEDMDKWILGKKKLSKKRLDKCFAVVMACELDCEKRAVRLIKRYNLPINIKSYTRKANVYVLFYSVVKKYRKWCEKSPSSIPELCNMMPADKFRKTWNNVPPKFEKIVLRKCLTKGRK